MNKVPPNLLQLIGGVVSGLNYALWGIELLPKQGGGQLLRVYIDTEAGIGVDDCEKVSRQLSAVLDVEDPIRGEYTLEVSSPGLDRPLFEQAQFARYVGEDIRVKLHASALGRKNYRGRLLSMDERQLQIQVDGETVSLAFDQIDTARVVPKF